MALRFKQASPVVAAAMALGLSGCFDMNVTINGEEGVPLSELEIEGASPSELVLTGSDDVIVTEGETLSIVVEGDDEAVEAVRFVLKDDTLGITRDDDLWDYDKKATIKVTMPAPKGVTITGSGNIETNALAEEVEISVLGSGSLMADGTNSSTIDVSVTGSGSARLGAIDAELLEVTLLGSGSVMASGASDKLEASVNSSGGARLSELQVNNADVSILGSGSASFRSDGTVEASIMGSGSVNVTGDAQCSGDALGSGSINCRSN